ncbi:MAG: ATP-dependent DNA helicase RecG [Candidatus Riflebacteria bacterium]|nr:ATP-dependent DNA helicase RecG [Candidatus Riflebacteria bacterium]
MARAAKTSKILLDDPVSSLSGVGPKKSEALNKAGCQSVFDILRFYPTRYQDRRKTTPVSMVENGKMFLLRVKLESIKSYFARRGLTVINAVFSDNSGKITAKWFNRTYLTKQLLPNFEYWVFGNVTKSGSQLIVSNPEVEKIEETNGQRADVLTPIYPSNARLSEAHISPLALRKLIAGILDNIDWENSLPGSLRGSAFQKILLALEEIHRPKSDESLQKAKYTLAFFDQVLFQIGVLKRRELLTGFLTLPDSTKPPSFKSPYPLPFKLTNGQLDALSEIVSDLKNNVEEGESGKIQPPMNRLVQGDVGSGKTLVAFLSMLYFSNELTPGYQCAFMAPTEILARQHLANFQKFFPQFADKAIIVTGSQKASEKRLVNDLIATGSALFVFGTHALFQEKITFKELGFCIIDEQQRFGVNHRRLLFNKGSNPNQLLLSATPIPRTLSLTIFGDMDTSIINEMPPGRSPVETTIEKSFKATIPVIKKELEAGHQVYIVCPLIELSEERDWVSVEEAADRVEDLLPDVSYATLTGAQTWEEKEMIMQSFKDRNLQILIATTVVEVGVDNPNATLMIIENADCFGLSQLHQLRGRVGRGSAKSSCILISHNDESSERLKVLASTNDGFELSMEDLKLRGPGDLVGTRQSGLGHPCFSHRIPQKLIENARKRAFEILTIEPIEVRNWFNTQMIHSFGESYKTFMEGG